MCFFCAPFLTTGFLMESGNVLHCCADRTIQAAEVTTERRALALHCCLCIGIAFAPARRDRNVNNQVSRLLPHSDIRAWSEPRSSTTFACSRVDSFFFDWLLACSRTSVVCTQFLSQLLNVLGSWSEHRKACRRARCRCHMVEEHGFGWPEKSAGKCKCRHAHAARRSSSHSAGCEGAGSSNKRR